MNEYIQNNKRNVVLVLVVTVIIAGFGISMAIPDDDVETGEVNVEIVNLSDGSFVDVYIHGYDGEFELEDNPFTVTTTVELEHGEYVIEVYEGERDITEEVEFTVDSDEKQVVVEFPAQEVEVVEDWVALNENTGTGYESIQDAVDNANEGEVITVAEGTHYEQVTIETEDIRLQSEDGENPSVISDPEGERYSGTQEEWDELTAVLEQDSDYVTANDVGTIEILADGVELSVAVEHSGDTPAIVSLGDNVTLNTNIESSSDDVSPVYVMNSDNVEIRDSVFEDAHLSMWDTNTVTITDSSFWNEIDFHGVNDVHINTVAFDNSNGYIWTVHPTGANINDYSSTIDFNTYTVENSYFRPAGQFEGLNLCSSNQDLCSGVINTTDNENTTVYVEGLEFITGDNESSDGNYTFGE